MADNRGRTAPDLDAIEQKWLQMCGACDAGAPTYCRCPNEDVRPAMSALVDEIRRLRSDSTSDKWHGR